MTMMRAFTFIILFCSVLCSKRKVKPEPRIAFFGEDVEIITPSLDTVEVLFKPSNVSQRGTEKVLMRAGNITAQNVTEQKLSKYKNHLVLNNVREDDEGEYVVRNINDLHIVRRILLIVRDCSNEHNVKYGETYTIPVHDVPGPIDLEFRHSPNEMNESTGPPAVLLNRSVVSMEEYAGRLSVTESRVSLHRVTRQDEGSYTIKGADQKEKKKMCLNVKEHQHFVHLQYNGRLKFNLYLNRTRVKVFYTPDSDLQPRLIVDQGELVVPMAPSLDGRVFLDGSMCILEHVRVSDKGHFKVMDMEGFPISNVYLDVDPYKLPTLFVAIISLLALVAFLLCICLLSCLLKVRRRAAKAQAITKIAQRAGKDEGDTFRQVVHDAYARFTEDSSLQSQWDNGTEKTEVDIKGLEVSKPGQYKVLSNDKETMDTSDSGVEFNTAGLPLDSDTDVPHTYASNKPLLDSDFLNSTTIPEVKTTPMRTPDSSHSPNLTTNSKLSGGLTPEPLGSGTLEADLMSHCAPDAAPTATDGGLSVVPGYSPSGSLIPGPEADLDSVSPPAGPPAPEQSISAEKPTA